MTLLDLNDKLTHGKIVDASEEVVAILSRLLQDETIEPPIIAGMMALQLGKLIKLIGLKELWPVLEEIVEKETAQIP